jgi:hypothetical protein
MREAQRKYVLGFVLAPVPPLSLIYSQDPVFSLDQPPDRIILDNKYPISSGGSCNIYRGSFQLNGRKLFVRLEALVFVSSSLILGTQSAIKLIRTSDDTDQLNVVLKVRQCLL